jgi:hypothetical protein
MSDLGEVCMHQGVDNGPHALFKEKWDRCKNCTYDPENNKKCPDYSKTFGYSQYNIPKSVSSPPENREDIRA